MENQRSRLAPGSVQRGEGPGPFDCEAPQGSLLDGCLLALRNIAPSGRRCGSSGTPCDTDERVSSYIGVDNPSCRNMDSIGTQRTSVSIGQSDGMSSDYPDTTTSPPGFLGVSLSGRKIRAEFRGSYRRSLSCGALLRQSTALGA